MATLKTLTIAAALIVGATSLASAQNGQPTGSYPPVAGGAGNNPATNPEGSTQKSTSHKSMKQPMKNQTMKHQQM